MRLVVIGPSGSGKSAVGALLAHRLHAAFVDADDLHPRSNVEKMAAGIPLTDDDRMPWLDVVGGTLRDHPGDIVIACSALARRYRDRIADVDPGVRFVALAVSRAELDRRMRTRAHFMPTSLLDSQLAAWEPLQPDENGFAIENASDLDGVVDRITRRLRAV